MSIIPETNISMRAVRSVLFEGTRSLWALCHSPKINKWAKFSPLTRGGGLIPYKSLPESNPYNCSEWLFQDNRIVAKLGEFANYDHDASNPVVVDFPEKIYSNRPSQVAVGLAGSDYSISISDVYPVNDKYFGVAIRKDRVTNYIWCTGTIQGGTSVEFDLTPLPYYNDGDIVDIVAFYTPTKKALDDADFATDFYSLKSDVTTITQKRYTLSRYVKPSVIDTIFLDAIPMMGQWMPDEVTFDDLRVTATTKVQANLQFKIKISTLDNRYSTEYKMQTPKLVEAGVETVVVNTGRIFLQFWQPYDKVVIEVIDLLDENRILVQEVVFDEGVK